MNELWGIDLGGTKVEGVILKSQEDPQVLFRERLPSESFNGYNHIQSQIGKVVDILKSKSGLHPHNIGMGTPGSIDPDTGLLKNSNSTALNGKPFLQDIQKILGVPVLIANDANCFALAEFKMGVVKEKFPEAQTAFGVIMGTGAGGGIVVEGKVLNGKNGISGEWGHNFLDESGGPCYCGKSGCVEQVISGTGLENFYEQKSGNRITVKEIMNNYEQGDDPIAQETVARLLTFFGLGLSNIVNILDPDVIVIGGGVGNIELLYTEGVKEVEKHVFNPTFKTPIIKPTLGDSAGVFGAAFLVE